MAERVLLLRFRLLGDLVLTTPAVRLLRSALPGAEIDYVVEPQFAPVVDGNSCVDRALLYDRRKIKSSLAGWGAVEFMRELRHRRYDVVIDLHGGPRSGVIARATGAPLRIGYTGPQSVLFYNSRIPRNIRGFRFHSVWQQARLLEPLGVRVGRMLPAVELPEPPDESLRVARELLDGASDFTGLAAMHVPPPNPYRNWGAGVIARVADGLGRAGFMPVFVGGEDGLPVFEQVKELIRTPFRSLLGSTGVMDLKAVLSASRVFVGVDSGPMHVAASTDVPIVALFGPNLPRISGPWSDRAAIIEESLECRPCDQRGCVHGDWRCLGRLGADRVLDAALRAAAASWGPRPSELPSELYGDPSSG